MHLTATGYRKLAAGFARRAGDAWAEVAVAPRHHQHHDIAVEFIQRLATLMPRPRPHLIRFHGVLAPSFTSAAKLRAIVVPDGPEAVTGKSELAVTE